MNSDDLTFEFRSERVHCFKARRDGRVSALCPQSLRMSQCCVLSRLGNLYKPSDRIGDRCPRCLSGKLYEQGTRFGGMIGCSNYFSSRRCTHRASPLPIPENYRCGSLSCVLHYGSAADQATDAAQSLHPLCLPVATTSIAPVSGLPLSENSSSIDEDLWDPLAIPETLFAGFVPSGNESNELTYPIRQAIPISSVSFSSFQPSQAPLENKSAPCTVANAWGRGQGYQPDLVVKKSKAKQQRGRPRNVLSDGCVPFLSVGFVWVF